MEFSIFQILSWEQPIVAKVISELKFILGPKFFFQKQAPEQTQYSRTCLDKDHPDGHKNCGLTRRVVFRDRFNCIEMCDLLAGISGLSRQVISHGSGLSAQVSLY